MGFIDRNDTIENLKEKNSKIPGTADWIKKNLNKEKAATIEVMKDEIIKQALRRD